MKQYLRLQPWVLLKLRATVSHSAREAHWPTTTFTTLSQFVVFNSCRHFTLQCRCNAQTITAYFLNRMYTWGIVVQPFLSLQGCSCACSRHLQNHSHSHFTFAHRQSIASTGYFHMCAMHANITHFPESATEATKMAYIPRVPNVLCSSNSPFKVILQSKSIPTALRFYNNPVKNNSCAL